jgi:hypothetical protein
MKIKILNRSYELKQVSQTLIGNERGNWGVIDHINLEIELFKYLNNIIKLETLLHECIHGIDNQLALDFDEKMIDKLACGFMSLILDNNWEKIIKFLK